MTHLGLNIEVSVENLLDPCYLPTHQDFADVFGVDQEDDAAEARWRGFCYHSKPEQYEILNVEFIESLGAYICARAGLFRDSPAILEVGAGSGRLTHFLNEYMDAADSEVVVVATDSGEQGIEPVFPVEQLSCEDTLNKYRPEIVLCSWMPYCVDFTAAIRSTVSVSEYLLIGETDSGCCGDEVLTWGVDINDDNDCLFVTNPLYKADGFSSTAIYDVSKHQICRTDSLGEYIHSKTMSFRREP